MEHLGDITKLDGRKLPSVDIITFGSPCQDLSVAGRRSGISGARSGLFFEAIRIINEMREATDGEYPRYAVWENVPGALSSNSGLDYQAVLEAFAKTEIPVPRSGHWANAGMVRGNGVDLAWVMYNAQHFGVPQRRKRLFLIGDFRGRSAAEILFVPKSLRGYFEAGGTPRQGAAAYVASGADRPMRGAGASHCLNPWDTQPNRVFAEDGLSPTLAGADGGGGRNPGGLVYAAFLGGAGATAGGIGYSEEVSPTLKGASGSNMIPCLCEPKLARTLTARGDSSPCVDRGQNIVTIPVLPDKVESIIEREILCAATSQSNAEILENQSPTLTCYHEQPIICEVVGTHQNENGDVSVANTANALIATRSATSCCAPPVSLTSEPIPIHDKATRYRGGGEKDIGPGNGLGIGKSGDPSPTLTTTEVHAVAVDCRNLCEREELSGTLQAKENGSYSLNYQNPIRQGYIIRRLTPTEAERLQGYPDGWTALGADGKTISDSRRYQMLGNSVAVPCVAYILMGIAEQMRKEES